MSDRDVIAALQRNLAAAEVERLRLRAALESVLDRCTRDYCGSGTPCAQCEVASVVLKVTAK